MTEYRIIKDRAGKTLMWVNLGDGHIWQLEPLPEDEKREPGIYDANFNLVDTHFWNAVNR